MKNLIKRTFIWFIIIGTISWAVSFIVGNTQPTFINTYQVNYGTFTKTLYYLDVSNYLKQLEQNVRIPFNQMFYDPPAFPKIAWNNILSSIPNLYIWWFNQLIWWFNIILFVPLKLALQPIILILTLLGIDLEQYGIITFIYKLYAIKPPVFDFI